ncbi:hypothetical protein KIPB_013269, partial [Kipferlia bialata]|eukprot:g13269.t1
MLRYSHTPYDRRQKLSVLGPGEKVLHSVTNKAVQVVKDDASVNAGLETHTQCHVTNQRVLVTYTHSFDSINLTGVTETVLEKEGFFRNKRWEVKLRFNPE